MERPELRVALVIFGDLDERSGGFLYDLKLARGLEAAGDEVRVVSQVDGGAFRNLAGNGRGTLRAIEATRPDLVLIDELNHAATLRILPRLKKRLAAPVVAVVHHLRSEESMGMIGRATERWMERSFLRGADAFVFNSGATERSALALAQVAGRPRLVAYPGKDRYVAAADVETAARGKAKPRRTGSMLRILFIGNLIPRKNLDILIRAAAALPPRTWRLDVCGDERIDPAYAFRSALLARELAGDAVAFHGRTDDGKLAALLEEADVLAVPSDLEGFGIVYLEAMAAGVVPVATSRGGAAEIIRDGVDGLLVPPRDEGALRRALAAFAGDGDLLRRMREAARERAAGFPTWDESMHEVRGFLHALVAGELP